MKRALSLADVAWRPPPLLTERLCLRGWEPTDARAIFAYASDPEVTAFVAWETHRSLDETRGFLDGWAVEKYRQQELDYGICWKDATATLIGGIGVYWASKAHKTMELGYVLRRDAWGSGVVPEAGRRLIRHAFEHTDVERIYAPILAPNSRSRRAAEKMGMTFEGIQRDAVLYHDQRWNVAIYSILRTDVG